MEIREDEIDQLLQARSEIDEELRRHKTRQTVLFTDIVGSTTYFDRFGDTEGLLLLYQHDALVKDAVEEFSGIVIKTIGDSVMAEFPDPLFAVHAAIAMQRLLLERNESLPRNERLQIRIGIHTGFGFKRANDLFGDLVNVAARITKYSGAAQILVSHSVVESIPATEVSFRSLGPVNLDGKAGAEELYEVYWADTDVYDMIRSSFSAFSTPADGESRGVTIEAFLASRIRVKALRALRAIRHLPGQFVKAIHETRAAAVVKPAIAFTVYAGIAAGIVSGRADTRLPVVSESSPTVQRTETQPPLTEALTAEMMFRDAPMPVSDARRTADIPAAPAEEPKPEPPAVAAPLESVAADVHPNWMKLLDTVPIPTGTFMMGDDSGKGEEKPRHLVKLDAFDMGRTEITNRQYLAFLLDTGHARPKEPEFAKAYLMDYPDFPVVNVSWDDAVAFCDWASGKYGVTVRLPTEAEWEYAALGGKHELPLSWGSMDLTGMARFKGNAPFGVRTVSADAFPPNNYGLSNMSGNVWEWMHDFYSKDYYMTSPIRSPKGPVTGTKHAIRGGSWANDDATLRVTHRSSRSPGDHSDQVGFRVVVVSEKLTTK